MDHILHIISSPRAERSCSVRLGKAIIRKLIEKNPDSTLTERDLTKDHPPFLSATQIRAFYKMPEMRSEEEKSALLYSDIVIREMQQADVVVIGAPMYNLGIAAPLKAWIDQVVRLGISFAYDRDGTRVGLLSHKKVYVAIASGRVHLATNNADFMGAYLTMVLQTIGITDIILLKAEGTAKKTFEQKDYDKIIDHLQKKQK